MEAAIDAYTRDLAIITQSGPFEITAEQKDLNRKVFENVVDIIPFDDIHKASDCDLIYRFLIAKRWDVPKAAQGLRDYIAFRHENNLNNILWEPFPAEIEPAQPTYKGVDKLGQPVFYNRPDPKLLGQLLTKHPRELLIRHHLRFIEEGRRICKSIGADRVSSVLDLSQMNMSIVTNVSAMGLLKEMSGLVQTHFPENMRTMQICNGGWTFSSLWTILKPFLDARVQQKVQVVSASGSKIANELAKFIDLAEVPASYGGSGPENPAPFPCIAEIAAMPPATATVPLALKKASAAAAFDSM